MDTVSFRRDVSLRSAQVKAALAAEAEAPEELPALIAWCDGLARIARLAVDFGHVVLLDERAETAAAAFRKRGRATFDTMPVSLLVLRCYQAHAASALRHRVDEQAAFFRRCRESNVPLLRAHGHSGGGFLALIEGDATAAEDSFAHAARSFLEAGSPADAVKVRVRTSMVLRLSGRDALARSLLEALLEEARALGVDAYGPLVSILATLGLDAVESGETAFGLRCLRDAVKLGNLVPRCQSALYAFSQYGNALLRAGRHGEAVVWLEKVEGLQRVLEPAAQATTQVLLFDAYLGLRRYGDAFRLSETLARHRMIGVDPDLRDEVSFHTVRLRQALADDVGAREAEASIADPEMRAKASGSLASAGVLVPLRAGSGPRACFDFRASEVIVVSGGAVSLLGFSRAPALRHVLLRLLMDSLASNEGLAFHALAPEEAAPPSARERAA